MFSDFYSGYQLQRSSEDLTPQLPTPHAKSTVLLHQRRRHGFEGGVQFRTPTFCIPGGHETEHCTVFITVIMMTSKRLPAENKITKQWPVWLLWRDWNCRISGGARVFAARGKRLCLPPPPIRSDLQSGYRIFMIRTSGCEPTFGVPSPSLPSYSLHFPLLPLWTLPFSIPFP